MLIARAPARISFGGGGTDLEAYYAEHGGIVVSAAIDKYFYTVVRVGDYPGVQIISSDYRAFQRQVIPENLIWNSDLALPRAIVNHFGMRRGLQLFLASEIPPGTGLGSSSMVAVGLVKALAALRDETRSRREIAELAAYIEIEKIGMPIGKQDQYASAFGGLNTIRFSRHGIDVEAVRMTPANLNRLQNNLLLFFTGLSRSSSSILTEQKEQSGKKSGVVVESLHSLKKIAEEMKLALERGDLHRFGQLLAESWQSKKLLSSKMSNPFIDECYALACRRGALGGKITGAGGGGFLMLYCEPEAQQGVTACLEARGLSRLDFKFDFEGAKVIMDVAPRSLDLGA